MKRQRLASCLALAEKHVAQGNTRLSEQRARIVRIDAAGHDSASARDLLRAFEVTQAMFIADRDRLIKEFEALG